MSPPRAPSSLDPILVIRPEPSPALNSPDPSQNPTPSHSLAPGAELASFDLSSLSHEHKSHLQQYLQQLARALQSERLSRVLQPKKQQCHLFNASQNYFEPKSYFYH